VLLSAREEVDRMSRTVDHLLTLAAVDDGVLGLRRQDTSSPGSRRRWPAGWTPSPPAAT
jgi:hypothetical protein